MWDRIRNNFTRGVSKAKWLSSLVSERFKSEFMVIKLLHQSEQLNDRRNDLLMIIGKRIAELRDRNDKNVLKDKVVADALSEIELIDRDIKSTKEKASDISKIEA